MAGEATSSVRKDINKAIAKRPAPKRPPVPKPRPKPQMPSDDEILRDRRRL